MVMTALNKVLGLVPPVIWLCICLALATTAATAGFLWAREGWAHAETREVHAKQVADAEKRVRGEVTAARDADVASLTRERDLALARARAAEATRGAVTRGEDGPVAMSLESAVESRRKE